MKNDIFIFILLVGALALAAGCRAPAPDIRVDGRFDDWRGVAPLYTDPQGDGDGSGIDFGRVWIADGGNGVFLSFELGKEISLQSRNGLVLYLDTDCDEKTGLRVGDIGADFSYRFGERKGFLYRGDDTLPFNAYDAGLVTAPTVTSSRFEIKLPRNAAINGSSLFPSGAVRVVLKDEGGWGGDAAPGPGEAPCRRLGGAGGRPYPPCPVGKTSPDHVRILTYNVLRGNIFREREAFSRILKCLAPDIIGMQEIKPGVTEKVREIVSALTGKKWNVVGHIDCYTLSRYPIVKAVPVRGAIGALIDLPGGRYRKDIFVINAHLGSGSKNARRQREADSIIALIRDAQQPGGSITLAPGTPIVIIGDLNLVGSSRQLRTLLTGDIAVEEIYGPDISPDWDSTPLTDLMPYHVASPEAYTWSNRNRRGYGPGRLDYVIFTDSAARVSNCFVLDTGTMKEPELSALGLEGNDCATASDHFPVVADFEVE